MRIMVVDDNKLFRKSLAKWIERRCEEQGVEVSVTQARDGKQAIALLGYLGEFDVVLSDREMPRMGGLPLLRHVEAQYPSTRRLLMSGNVGGPDVQEAVDSGLLEGTWDKASGMGVLLGALGLEAPAQPPREPGPEPQDPEDPEDPEIGSESLLEAPPAPSVEPVDGRLTRAHVSSHVIAVILQFLETSDWGAYLHCYTGLAKNRQPTERERRWVGEIVQSLASRVQGRRTK